MFDFILIGGGTAGCTLAGRLTQTHLKVLLIEAGPDLIPGSEPAHVKDPFPRAAADPALCWPTLRAEARSRPNQPAEPRPFLQARVLGGGSTINGMAALRGLPSDYDEWTGAGARGWGWDDVLPYFVKLENDHDFQGPLHGQGGPVPIRRVPTERWPPFCASVTQALRACGHPFRADLNADFRDGVGPLPMNCTAQTRVSAVHAYLDTSARKRPNLHVLTNTTVQHIIWNAARACGVQASGPQGSQRYYGAQIIVCAGAIHSPTLLMRSGVGPGDQLSALGINVVQNRPGVGKNLLNHATVSLAVYLRPRARQSPKLRELWHGMLRYSSGLAECSPGDMMLTILNRTAAHAIGQHVGALGVHLGKSYSRGEVRLAGAHAEVPPRIEFRLGKDERDWRRLVEGLRLCCSLLADPNVRELYTEAFFAAGPLVQRLNRPGWSPRVASSVLAGIFDRMPIVRHALLRGDSIDAVQLLGDKAHLESLVREHMTPTFHPAGTCRIGAPSDPQAVVDSECRVIGVEGLRIIDASVMPTMISGTTNIPVMMIGEKMASRLLAERRL
jgi:5-(hydroxymethyl)furfural/furfural oxidase